MAMVVALSSELVKRGHEVDVVCIDRPSGSDHEALWSHWLMQHGVRLYFLGRKLRTSGAVAAAKLWWLVQRRRYNVVHSHLPMPDGIAGLVRRSSPHDFTHIVTVHNTHEPRSRTLEALGSGAHVVYCSEAARKCNPLPGLSSIVIPNGIPETPYQRSELSGSEMRQRLGLRNTAKVAIAVGRLCAQKNFGSAIEALAVVKTISAAMDVHCLICGEGDDRRRLEARALELGLDDSVHFLGARTDMPNLLAASDVFLTTSKHEGMPLSVLEALHAGLPCVLSAIQEHYELADSMPGCTFVSHAPQAIALALESAFRNPVPADVLRHERAPLLHKHSIECCADSYQSLYQARCHLDLQAHPIRS